MRGDDYSNDVLYGPALTRLDCPTCGPETLHKRGICVHCGRQYKPPLATIIKPPQLNRARRRWADST